MPSPVLPHRNGKKTKSKFTLEMFPLTKTSAKTTPDVTDQVNILLVDDTPENLIALEAVLANLKQNIVKAASGAEALRLLLRMDFAAIILDVNMPGMNGFETAALIRQRKNSEHTPIIFVSAISTSDIHIYKGYALGAVDYIFTPVVPDVLRSKVAVFVELLKKTEQVKAQAERLRQIEEKEHQNRLREAAQRLELETKRNRFFNLSIDMLSIAGFNGFFKQLNPTWSSILGFSQDELKSRPFIDFVHPDDQPATRHFLEKLKSTDSPVYFENRYACKDGSFRWLAWTAASFVAEELFYLFARDVTRHKETEEKICRLNDDLARRASQLQTANSELEFEINVRKRAENALKDTNAELESFCYSVSHDLRAPLRAMQAFADALVEDCSKDLTQTGQDCARRIMAAASRMDRLIQDLLAYSRISHVELQLQPVNLDSIIHESLGQLGIRPDSPHPSISLQQPFYTVVAHHSTLVQVVCNLLANALKFVAQGTSPQVHLRMERLGDFGRLWVEDNGIGIAPEYHTRIFRVFERLHGVDSYPGTGIGLAIVRKGIERMNGKVGLESAPEKGSRFWIELPLAEVPIPTEPTPTPSP